MGGGTLKTGDLFYLKKKRKYSEVPPPPGLIPGVPKTALSGSLASVVTGNYVDKSQRHEAEPLLSNHLTRQIFMFFSYGFFNSLIKNTLLKVFFIFYFFATKPADL